MISFASRIHRTCDHILAGRDDALRESEGRVRHLSDQLSQTSGKLLDVLLDRQQTRSERDQLVEALAESCDREDRLRADLMALTARHAALNGVLEQRRRRAAERALGGAWASPKSEESMVRAQVAQGLLALPLASYDVTLTYDVDRMIWLVDGEPVDTTGFMFTSPADVLIGRYGFTEHELDRIKSEAKRAHHEAEGGF